MRKIELAPGICSSALGFGCAPILGSVGGRQAEAALNLALELGVTHLDVAPSYGFGEAEKWLGKFLRGRRNEVVLATKFGIEATSVARWLGPVKPLVRALKGRQGKEIKEGLVAKKPAGEQEKDAKRRPGRFFRRPEMNQKNLEKGVERSLRDLRSDYIDLLLLHEPPRALPAWAELREAAERMKRAGKIRAFGVAYECGREAPIKEVLEQCDVQQFKVPLAEEDYGAQAAAAISRPGILFSAFSSAGPGVDRGQVLKQLFKDFPKCVILCSMFSKEHIRRNVESSK